MSEPGVRGIAELRQAYLRGERSPGEVVRSLLEAASRDDLRAVAWLDPLGAARGAAQAELQASSGSPLTGVPFFTKDIFAVAGRRMGAGSRAPHLEVAREDALAVARLRQAGAVLLGGTALLEFALGLPHPAIPATANPWDPERTAGGSSGGSAAAVAQGWACFALGTDSGGSVRIPASYCGVVGFKPSYGWVPTEGVFPLAPSFDHVGFLAQSCADLPLLLELTSGRSLEDFSALGLRGLRLGRLRSPGDSPEVAAALERSCQSLAERGAQVVELDLDPLLDPLRASFGGLLLAEAGAVHLPWLESGEGYGPATLALLRAAAQLRSVDTARARWQLAGLSRQLAAAMAGVDALISPTVPFQAPREDPAPGSPEGDREVHYTAPWNMTGFPALSLPPARAGAPPGSLPTGLQLVGGPGQDAKLLRSGALIEAALHPDGLPRPRLAAAFPFPFQEDV